MSDDTTGKTSKPESRTNWRRLRGMSDDDVHAAIVADPEIRPTDEEFWKTARLVRPAVTAGTLQRKRTPLTFRPDIHFDPQNDDAIMWGDSKKMHFRMVIRRRLLVTRYGLKKFFDNAGAEVIIRQNRACFEKVAQDAYDAGASEIIIG